MNPTTKSVSDFRSSSSISGQGNMYLRQRWHQFQRGTTSKGAITTNEKRIRTTQCFVRLILNHCGLWRHFQGPRGIPGNPAVRQKPVSNCLAQQGAGWKFHKVKKAMNKYKMICFAMEGAENVFFQMHWVSFDWKMADIRSACVPQNGAANVKWISLFYHFFVSGQAWGHFNQNGWLRPRSKSPVRFPRGWTFSRRRKLTPEGVPGLYHWFVSGQSHVVFSLPRHEFARGKQHTGVSRLIWKVIVENRLNEPNFKLSIKFNTVLKDL